MCGIAGIINFTDELVKEDILYRMGEAIKHRGPDDSGVWTNGKVGFAHQRLSIIDTSKDGHQPMHSSDKRYSIIFNGEIYNHNEFRAELKAKGFNFKSTSDTEVLLYMYITYGASMLHRLNGMFAFAIWDEQKKELFVARDRFGVKPLYYYLDINKFIFASESKAIFATGVAKEINSANLNEWLMYRYVAGENTLYKGIHKLLPGHTAIIKPNGHFRDTRWYHLGDRILSHAKINNPKNWFEETFHQSVKYRMMADVPVGVLLSGGLDSSSITASLKLSGFKDISTFNIGFKDYVNNESDIAQQFSKSLNYPFHSIKLEGNELYNTLIQSIHHLEEPLVHMNDPQILAISSYAKKHVKVLLSGEGADEIMGGYVRYKTFRYIGLRNQIYYTLKLTPEKYKNNRLKKLERYLKIGGLNQLIMGNASNYFESDFDELGINYLGISNDYRSRIMQEARLVFPNNPTKQLLYYDQHTYLQSLNERNDSATMAAGIECREPFQDYRIVEGIGTLNTNWLTAGKKGKKILFETMKHHLPENITSFRKIGLSVPWIKQIKESESLSELWNSFMISHKFNQEILDKVDLKPAIAIINKGESSHYEPLVLQYFMYYIWTTNQFKCST
jgi:asparagine synthase (glutamine-hydrolysing)